MTKRSIEDPDGHRVRANTTSPPNGPVLRRRSIPAQGEPVTLHVVSPDAYSYTAVKTLLAARPDIAIRLVGSTDRFAARVSAVEGGVVLLDMVDASEAETDLLHALSQRDGAVVVIAVTSSGNVPLAVRAMQAGAIDVVERPLLPARLLASIEAAIARIRAHGSVDDGTQAARSRVARLSPRERAVFDGLICGWPNKIIAEKLALSQRTVEIHRARMMTKLDVRTLAQAFQIAVAAKIFDEPDCA